jgi:hypothetical protein
MADREAAEPALVKSPVLHSAPSFVPNYEHATRFSTGPRYWLTGIAEADLLNALDQFRRDHPRLVHGPMWMGLLLLAIPATMAAAFLWAIWQTLAG